MTGLEEWLANEQRTSVMATRALQSKIDALGAAAANSKVYTIKNKIASNIVIIQYDTYL